MMRLGDTLKLAYTKLRTRRLRLFISLLVSSLLFSVLMAGTLVVTGALGSLDSFSKEGFSNRYILAGINQIYDTSEYNLDKSLIARVEQLDKEEKVAKKAAAKRLGIEYDDKTDIGNESIFTDPTDGQKQLNITAPLAQRAIGELQAKDQNLPSLDKFKRQVGVAEAYYVGVFQSSMNSQRPSLVQIEDGKEQTDIQSKNFVMSGGMSDGSTGLQTMPAEWNLLDKNLLKPFVLPGQNLELGDDGSIPIIASYSAAQEVLKLPKLSANATTQDKKKRLEDVRAQIAGQTFEFCYRNFTSTNDYQMAVQQQEDIRKNSKTPGYTKPDLVYNIAGSPCQAPVVERDVRSFEVKSYQQKQDQFDREFGKPAPVSQILKYRIVGVTQDSPYSNMSTGAAGGLLDVISMMTASSVGARWVSPLEVRDSSAATKDIFSKSVAQLFGGQEIYFAEYSSPDTARQVLKTKTCRDAYGMPTGPISTGPGDGSLPICTRSGESSFILTPFGSASLAIDDFKTAFQKVQLVAALVIGGIAAFILMGVIGRIIADARKETAVFRATGASRFMIAQIYIAYTLYLVLIMIALSLLVGFGLALWFNSMYSPETSINMALLFNVGDLSKQFTFYALDFRDVGVISLAVLAAAFVGASVPIAGNIRRNPMRDMRDE